MASDNGYIKLFSKFKYWGWYTDSKAVHLFIHLLLLANFKDGWFLGERVMRGELATSVGSLSRQTGLTTQEVRTRLKNFEKTGEINKRTNKQFTIITICNFESYQRNPNEDNTEPNKRLTNDQQTPNKRLTTIEEDKTIRLKEDKCISTRTQVDLLKSKETLTSAEQMYLWVWRECNDLFNMKQPLTIPECERLLKEYKPQELKDTLNVMDNKWDQVKKLKSTNKTVRAWLRNRKPEEQTTNKGIKLSSGFQKKNQ